MNLYIDGHCDTLTVSFNQNEELNNPQFCFNQKDAKKMNIPVIQSLGIFINPNERNGFDRAKEVITYHQNRKNQIKIIQTKKDLDNLIHQCEIGGFFSIENGKAIEKEINNIDYFYQQGVRMMSITWNDDNLLGTGALTKENYGLTDLGVQYIQKLEEKGILIDVSHASEQTFWDVIQYSTKTIVATHSCCYKLCQHPRNLKDDQIREIAKRNGIVGICFCSPFLKKNGKGNVDDIIQHIDYIIQLVGEDYVGLGTDFDGVEKEHQLNDIKGIRDISILEKKLKEKGYQETRINKIMGENWLRVLKKVL